MTTPTAPWSILIEGKELDLREVRVRADEMSAYFLMVDNRDEITVSIYIEPIDKCKTSEECRDYILNTGNPAWGPFQDLTKSSIGDFISFEFFRPEVRGLPIKMQDMYAQYVSDGYWVDVHLSKALYKKDDRQIFEKLIKSFKFVRKSGSETNSQEGLENTIQTTAKTWLALWDGGKCKASYAALTSFSRQAVKEENWVDYCIARNKALGSVRERKILASTFTPSFPGKPGHSGATLRFRTMLENGPVIEFVSLTTEKNGEWTVSNYLTQ